MVRIRVRVLALKQKPVRDTVHDNLLYGLGEEKYTFVMKY